MIKIILAILFFLPFTLQADQAYSNVLVPGENVQVSSEINAYDNIVPGMPIQGSVMVTHDANNAVDMNSFRIGDQPLKVVYVNSVPMSSYNNLVVTIYKFQLDAMPAGMHVLQPIRVKVGGKNYVSPPLTVTVSGQ
jgi:hypothetical protein